MKKTDQAEAYKHYDQSSPEHEWRMFVRTADRLVITASITSVLRSTSIGTATTLMLNAANAKNFR